MHPVTLNSLPRWAKFLVLLSLLGIARTSSAAPVANEYQVKAVFLFNFSQFVEWPEGAFENASAPFVIGVLGNDPFGATLDETVRGEKIKGRRVVVRRYQKVASVADCHILYVSQGATDSIEDILSAQKQRGILTVGERADFAKKGGVIRFYMDSNRVRFGINLEAARSADLSVSSKLLRHAEIEPSSFEPTRLRPTMFAGLGTGGALNAARGAL